MRQSCSLVIMSLTLGVLLACTNKEAATTMDSAFEETKPYVLTELGKQFVHYTMNEVVTRIGEPSAGSPAA